MTSSPHISLAAETLFHLGPLPVTNSLLTTWVVMAFLLCVAFLVKAKLAYAPNRGQAAVEYIIDSLDNLFHGVLGSHQARQVFALITSIFFFVIVSNWSGLIPGVGSIGIKHVAKEETHEEAVTEDVETEHKPEFIPLFRAPTADLNTTIALALVAVGSIQFLGFKAMGAGYLKKFFNFSSPIMFFVGFLELVSEFSRIISFTFRLFGNIFAGEVLLTVIAYLVPVVAPIPFLGLELFVGFIQALVFSMLTATFLSMAISHDEH